MKTTFAVALLMMLFSNLEAQTTFRKAIFLHHSTGGNIYYKGSNTTVLKELANYNMAKSFTGNQKITMAEEWFGVGNNEWNTMRNFVEGTNGYKISNYFSQYNVIIIKSCFPSSEVISEGSSADTKNPIIKSIYNYKWHWRSMVKYMQKHPEIFFVIWTNAPLEAASTKSEWAANAKNFCNWATNILAKGLDSEYGAFPPNVFVFDFFGKLTDSNGNMKDIYKTKSGDSHPNAAAADLIAPQFVKEIFDAALAYERVITSMPDTKTDQLKIFPIPAQDYLTIEVDDSAIPSTIALTNLCGQKLFSKVIDSEVLHQKVTIDVSKYPSGLYLVNIESPKKKTEVHKIIIQ